MVEMSEKISVIVPVYNVEPYIEKCIESVLNQTYENLEVLLIDDGSTDKSGSICELYAKRDSRVHVYHKINEGLSEARNVGVKLSSANYIVFVDSDDYIENDMIDVLYKRLQKDKSDLAICNFMYVDEAGQTIAHMNERKPIKDEVISGAEAFEKLASEKYWYYVTAWNKLYRRQLLEGIEFPKGKIHEDEFVAHYIFDKCQKVSCIEKSLYMYIQRKKSIMNRSFSVKRLDGVEALCERALYALKRNNYVAEDSLIKAGGILLEGYRVLGGQKEIRHILRKKRRLYNKAYLKCSFIRLRMKTRLRGFLLLIHPYVCLKVSEWVKRRV